jgi:hypothetical protein
MIDEVVVKKDKREKYLIENILTIKEVDIGFDDFDLNNRIQRR